jgi:hypothetical protein
MERPRSGLDQVYSWAKQELIDRHFEEYQRLVVHYRKVLNVPQQRKARSQRPHVPEDV